MYKCGCDIVKISRIKDKINKEHFINSVFTNSEIDYCKSAENYAGIFAAKEAFLKANGTGINIKLNTLEVSHNDLGKPFFPSFENADLSISHDGEYAIAFVIINEE